MLPLINESVFVNDVNCKRQIKDASEMVQVLTREAAAIEVLAETYRATI